MQAMNDHAFRDVLRYPRDFLRLENGSVRVPVTYKKEWDDGFGARGWKLDVTIGDPEIIASTRESGQRIPTSVLVHDLLDHFFSGFGVSGHRSEAMALIQLSARTGADPRPDYQQMVKEDMINGRVNGETLMSFLPDELASLFPVDADLADKERINWLKQKLGVTRLTDLLVEHFFTLGEAGIRHAADSWEKLGLDPEKRSALGLALQEVLTRVDGLAESAAVDSLAAEISVNHVSCAFILHDAVFPDTVYAAAVDRFAVVDSE